MTEHELDYAFARCRGSKEIYVGSPGYGSPGGAYAPCFGCPDCLREEDAWICDGCGKWAAIDTVEWEQRGPDDAGVTVEFCPSCKPGEPEAEGLEEDVAEGIGLQLQTVVDDLRGEVEWLTDCAEWEPPTVAVRRLEDLIRKYEGCAARRECAGQTVLDPQGERGG